ncbi:MAG TPA: hypothetical protein VEG30_02990 [Terriglobales bacterium]|nr:hypothetical protein [Terriglobales bacterium]
MPAIAAESLARTIQEFVAASRGAVVVEEGSVIFDLSEARYSLATEHDKCVLHFWSPERNAVRRVLDAEVRKDILALSVQRFGKSRPTQLEICRERDQRTPSAKRAQRSSYLHRLRRAFEHRSPDFMMEALSSTIDLERSFSPIYARGWMRKGNTAFAVLGVNSEEMQASIDASLTFGILWLDHLREREAGRLLVAGLRLVVPQGKSAIVRERVACLNREAAAFTVLELDERTLELEQQDASDRGNIATRLIFCPNLEEAQRRFEPSIARIRKFIKEFHNSVFSAAEISFRMHGLEFARARLSAEPASLRHGQEIVFGLGPSETVLSDQTEPLFAEIVQRLVDARQPKRPPGDEVLWRLAPERWLESLVVCDVRAVDHRLDRQFVYSQVPAFSAADRAMIDVLTVTREHRLAVLELKADEDIHLPLQGLDYWARVCWHQERDEFQKFGYFPGIELQRESPLLLLIAPALRIHPATDILLRYVSPEISWELVAIDERWREGLKVVFRKRRR